MPLRAYQVKAVHDLRVALRTYRAVCLQLATGAGKTWIAGDIAQRVAAKGNGILALVHRKELVTQFCETLDKFGLGRQYGVIRAQEPFEPWKRFQVASIPTLVRRPFLADQLNPRIVIVDEAHHVKAKSWETVLSWFPTTKIIGMTATPARLDRKPLGDHFQVIVPGPPVSQLIAEGYLAPIDMRYISDGMNRSGLKRLGGEYSRKDQASRLTAGVIAKVSTSFRRYAFDRSTIFFAINTDHSMKVRDQLRALGVTAEHVDAKTPANIRDRVVRDFRANQTQVFCNVDIAGEGTDFPNCSAVMLGMKTLSLTRYLQWCGRAMRPDHGRHGLILDLAGNVWNHGSPDEDRTWSLEDTVELAADNPKTAPARRFRYCRACGTVYPIGRSHCPECGTKATVTKLPKEIDVELAGGPRSHAQKQIHRQVARELRSMVRRGKQSDSDLQRLSSQYKLPSRWVRQMKETLGL